MKNPNLLLLSCLAMLVFSCKDDDATTNPTLATDYFPLTKGSYWIYDWYTIDSLGNEASIGRTDTLKVTGDTILNGIEYSVVEGTLLGTESLNFYRDSSGYLDDAWSVTPELSVDLGAELGQDTILIGDLQAFWTSESMEPELETVTVPAGKFESCLVKVKTLYPLEFDIPAGVRTYPHYFAKGVGMVKYRTSFLSSFDYLESRLVKYKIE